MKKKILKKFIHEVWNEGNIDSTSDFITSTYTIHHDPGDPWDGMTLDLKGFQERVRKSRAPIPDQRFDIQDIFENENGLVITWQWEGTHLGDIAGFPATGKQIQMSGATVYYFDGDRISGHWQIVDRLGLYQQLQRNSI